jgi:hypothetical protein
MRRLAPLLWYGFIFASSCKSVNGETIDKEIRTRMPGAKGDRWSAIWKKGWWIPVKGWHAMEFGILYALLRNAGASKANAMLLIAAAASLDEYHQTFVEGRTGTPRDVLIDMGGALAAAGIETLIEPKSPLDSLPRLP